MTPFNASRLQPRRHGMSIVEMMVGLVVGLLVSLAAVSSAQMFLATQRQGIGVGSGAASTASTLAAIKNDVANGGLGFFGNLSYLCTTMNFSVNGAVVSNNTAFSPVQVARAGSNDTLDIVYGSEVAAGAAVKLATASDGTSATLKTYLPIAVNQSVLIAAPTLGTPCTIRTLTAASAAPTAEVKQTLTLDASGTYNQGAYTTNPSYPENSLVSLIGTPQWSRYSLNGTDLQLTNMLAGTTVTLLRNVIGFHVEYGVSAAGTPGVDGNRSPLLLPYQKSTAAGWSTVSNANIAQIKALRIGIVVRSAQREKVNNQTSACEASANKPVLFGDTIEPDVVDWKCYRYRTQVVVAPLRNLIYGL